MSAAMQLHRQMKMAASLTPGVEIALIRLSGLSKKLSGQVDRPRLSAGQVAKK